MDCVGWETKRPRFVLVAKVRMTKTKARTASHISLSNEDEARALRLPVNAIHIHWIAPHFKGFVYRCFVSLSTQSIYTPIPFHH